MSRRSALVLCTEIDDDLLNLCRQQTAAPRLIHTVSSLKSREDVYSDHLHILLFNKKKQNDSEKAAGAAEELETFCQAGGDQI